MFLRQAGFFKPIVLYGFRSSEFRHFHPFGQILLNLLWCEIAQLKNPEKRSAPAIL
jgi:hypothetical protein